MTAAPLIVYGGTFDPVHRGHVAVAKAAADALQAERVLLIPCGDPPHRGAPVATGALRAELLRLAFADDPRMQVDLRELQRDGPSYMVDTLASVRAEQGAAASIALLLGLDAARGLPGWHRWQALPALAHLVLVPRPGGDTDPGAAVSAAWTLSDDPRALRSAPAGRGYCLPQALSDASSTRSREQLARGATAAADLPPAVARRLAGSASYRHPGSGEK